MNGLQLLGPACITIPSFSLLSLTSLLWLLIRIRKVKIWKRRMRSSEGAQPTDR